MSLATYKKKRNFKKTSEPAGKEKSSKGKLLFVVQEHSATRLHYDFRLEMEGVLKSWAVPKGPSMNPDDKRLAMHVEDHPYDYKDFEGTIPEGNYGAGNVIVWDNGWYQSYNHTDKKDAEKELLAGLHKGHITFILHGKKLKGEFALVKMKGRGENAWLLLKAGDEYATKEDILLKNKSVVTRKILKPREKKNPVIKKPVPKPEQEEEPVERIKPMLAQLSEKPFDDSAWGFEIKFDGYRALAGIKRGKYVDLYSRNFLSFNKQFAPIAEELKKFWHDAILDGEVVVLDKKGVSSFQLLQNYQKTGAGDLKYYVFDILHLDGVSTRGLKLEERKELLQTILAKKNLKNVFYSDHIIGEGKKFYKLAQKMNLEGIIAKKLDSTYHIGKRTADWLKIKITQEQEAVIAGITEPGGGRKHFGSLVLGAYINKKFQYIGNAGTGFSDAALKELHAKFKPYFTDKSPFDTKVKAKTKIQWMKPHFVCQVKYTEWTDDMSMRHPVYLGLREDKKPEEVVPEVPKENLRKAAKKEIRL